MSKKVENIEVFGSRIDAVIDIYRENRQLSIVELIGVLEVKKIDLYSEIQGLQEPEENGRYEEE